MPSTKRKRRPPLTPKEQTQLKEEVRRVMIKTARTETTISYSGLAKQIRTVPMGARDPRLHQLLNEIGENEDDAGRGLLCVVVVKQSGSRRPGIGFYAQAGQRGRSIGQKKACFVEELQKVHAAWRQQR